MRRLFVDKITSIGAVSDGDNPQSKIMLFKTRDTDSVPTGEPVMDIEEREAFEKTQTELETQVADLETKIAELTEEPVDVLKDAPDELREQFAKQQEQIEEQAVELAKERDARLTAEFAKTAEKYIPVLGDDGGTLLKAFSAHDDEYKTLIAKLDTMVAVIETADLFKELGVNDQADPKSQIEALAIEKQKDNPDLTTAQARALVRTERPDLKQAERETV